MKDAHMKLMVLGVVIAIMLAFAGGMEYASQQDEQAADLLVKSSSTMRENQDRALASWRKIADDYEAQAQACQAKFDVFTLLIEPRPATPMPSIPLMHGMLSLSLNSSLAPLAGSGGALGGNNNGMAAMWQIPAQIRPESTLPGAMYRWIDPKTGEVKGTFAAVYPGMQGNQ